MSFKDWSQTQEKARKDKIDGKSKDKPAEKKDASVAANDTTDGSSSPKSS